MTRTNEIPIFIVVDDDETNNLISRLTILNTIEEGEVITFTSPHKALEFITVEFANDNGRKAILLLNLKMPLMSGWQFLENLMKVDGEIQDRITVYILTSSIDPADRIRSQSIAIVKGYLDKPLSAKMIGGIWPQ